MAIFEAALLDVDGTLLASNEAHARAWVEALAEEGYYVGVREIERMIGMGGDRILPSVAPELASKSDAGKRIGARRERIFEQWEAPRLKPTTGARTLLLALRERGIRRIVASSAQGSELDMLLRLAGVEDLVDGASTSDDAKESKPSPDIVMAALAKAKVDPSRAFMVGDTPYDVEAANRANVRIVSVRCGGWNDAALAGSWAIYDDPAAIAADLDRLLSGEPAVHALATRNTPRISKNGRTGGG